MKNRFCFLVPRTSRLLNNFQSFNPELPAGDQLGIFALAGGALGVPGGAVQGENERTCLALQLGRDSG